MENFIYMAVVAVIVIMVMGVFLWGRFCIIGYDIENAARGKFSWGILYI
jgi:hypothetical protein